MGKGTADISARILGRQCDDGSRMKTSSRVACGPAPYGTKPHMTSKGGPANNVR